MPATDQQTAIGWISALAVIGWIAIAAVAGGGGGFAQDLGGQGPASRAENGPDLGSGGHPEIKAAARKAIAAERQFLARTKDVNKTGQAPRQADPAFAPLLDAVFDVGIVQKTDVAKADGGAIAQWLRASIHVGAVYVRAGTGVTSVAEMANDVKARERSDRNVALYAPEIGRFMDAEIILEAALLGTIFKGGPEPDDARLGEARDQMRAGLEMTVVGLLRTLAASGLSSDWRLERLAVLDAATPQIARILDPERCGHLRKVATDVATKLRDPRVGEKLTGFGAKLGCAKG